VPTPAGRCAGLIVLTLFGLINFPGRAAAPVRPSSGAAHGCRRHQCISIAYIAYNAVYATGAYPAVSVPQNRGGMDYEE